MMRPTLLVALLALLVLPAVYSQDEEPAATEAAAAPAGGEAKEAAAPEAADTASKAPASKGDGTTPSAEDSTGSSAQGFSTFTAALITVFVFLH